MSQGSKVLESWVGLGAKLCGHTGFGRNCCHLQKSTKVGYVTTVESLDQKAT